MRRRAFTLIELLVVIAIIAILAAILFPVFAQARESARKTSCNSNMKQLGLAFNMYQTDHDGAYPSVYDDVTFGSNQRIIWADKIRPYIKNRDIFRCPGGPTNVTLNPSSSGFPADNVHGTRYVMNMVHGWHWPEGMNNTGTLPFPVTDSQFVAPAGTALLFEGSNTWWCHWHYSSSDWNKTQTNSNGELVLVGVLNEFIYPRHQGGTNVLFVDGHVKWLRTNSLINDKQLWNIAL